MSSRMARLSKCARMSLWTRATNWSRLTLLASRAMEAKIFRNMTRNWPKLFLPSKVGHFRGDIQSIFAINSTDSIQSIFARHSRHSFGSRWSSWTFVGCPSEAIYSIRGKLFNFSFEIYSHTASTAVTAFRSNAGWNTGRLGTSRHTGRCASAWTS